MKNIILIVRLIVMINLLIGVFFICLYYFLGGFLENPTCYFINPSYIFLIGMIVPFSWLYFTAIKKMMFTNWGKSSSITISKYQILIQFSLICLLWYSLVIAAAMPIYGSEKAKSTRTDLELIVCLDISKSMNVKDMQGSSRLEVAKRVINSIVSKSSGEKIGVCVFAGNVLRELEITRDYDLIRNVCSNIESELIEQQGTDITAAFQQAKEMFNPKTSAKAIILITDGENHESSENDESILKSIPKDNIKVCILGLGSENGGPIPESALSDSPTSLLDDNGTEYISKIDKNFIKSIASSLGGSAIISNESHPDVDPILTQINQIKGDNSRTLDVDIESMRYKWFVYLAIVCFSMLLLLPVLWKK